MQDLNDEKLEQVAAEAFGRAGGSRRWQNAVTRAWQILRDTVYWHMTEDGSLLLLSPDSSELYETDGRTCSRIVGERRVSCRAYSRGYPCKHRAAHRLLVRYREA